MTQTRKIIAAVLAVLTLGVLAAQSAGALGTPWWCKAHSGVSAICDTVELGRTVDRKADAAADAAKTTYKTGEAAGSVVVEGTGLAGTILDKTAAGLSWANDQAQRIPVPSRSLRPGECITTAAGATYCLPEAASKPAPTSKASPVPVGTCVIDSNGRKWCVQS